MFKLSTVEELFPDKAKKLKEEDKEYNYGHMFKLDSERKKNIVKIVTDCVEECKKQRVDMIERKKQAINNYEGIKDASGPWEGSSNISTMVTTISCDLMHSKLLPMVWNPDLMHFIGREKHDDNIADNNKILMHWAVTKDMEDSQDKADEMVWRLVVEGLVIVKTQGEIYYPHVTRAVPKSVNEKGEIKYEVQYDQVRRERAKWCIKDIDKTYFPVNAINVREAEYIIEEAYFTYPMILELKAQGLLLPDFDTDKLKDSLERLLEPDSLSETRNLAMGLTEYKERMESYPIKIYEAFLKYDINDDNFREECIFITFPDLEMYGSGKPLHCVSKVGIRPWVIRPFFKRPGTMIGKGIPEIVYHLHNEMDAIHNQRIDAGNMVIAPFFFYRPASGFDPQKINIRPAMGIPLDDPQRDVVFPNYNASRLSVSFQEEGMIRELIEQLTYVTPTVLGKETANRPTARGTMAIIAQGDERFTAIGGRVVKAFSDLLTITRRWYEENLDPSVANRILGKSGKQVWLKLSPEMIAGDYDCYQPIDLTAQTETTEKEADQLMFQTLSQDPFVNQNPAYAWELRANYLKSIGKKDFEKIIGPKPDYQLSPGDIEDENLLMYQEQAVEVKDSDDHLAHINAHAQFKRMMSGQMTPQALILLTTHLLEHRFKYTQALQQQALMGQQGGQNGATNQGQAGNTGALNAPRMGTIQGPPVGGSTGSSQSPVGAPAQANGGGQGGGGY